MSTAQELANGDREPLTARMAREARERLLTGQSQTPRRLEAEDEGAAEEGVPQIPERAKLNTEQDVLRAIGTLLDRLSELAENKTAAKRLEFSTAGVRFTVVSPLVSVQNDCVGFFINKNQFTFEPSDEARFKMTYQGIAYDLVYLGGFFTFPNLPYALVSFMRIRPEPTADENP